VTLSPTMRLFLWFIAIVSALVAGRQLVDSFEANEKVDELHRKDFIQEYVFAKAVVAGEDPYLPIPQMVARWFDPAPDGSKIWAHPAPHTPVTAILSTPLAFLEYPTAALVWLIFELVLLALAWETLIRWWGGAVSWATRILLYLASLSLGPLIQELFFGNLSLILLALMLPAWLSLRKNNDVTGGIWLGLAIAIKLTGWPIVLWLAMKMRWRAVLAAGAVVVGLHLIAAIAIGLDHVIDYYRRVGPGIAREYRQHDGNYSLWTIGPRLFLPFHSVFNNFVAEVPFDNPSLAEMLSKALPVVGLAIGLYVAWRCEAFDSSFGILVCLSLPVNPVAWDHSLLLISVPIAIVLKRLSLQNWPPRETTVAVICFVLAMFPQKAYLSAAAQTLATPNADGIRMMPFLPGLITYVPLLSLMGWITLLWRTDSRSTPHAPREQFLTRSVGSTLPHPSFDV